MYVKKNAALLDSRCVVPALKLSQTPRLERRIIVIGMAEVINALGRKPIAYGHKITLCTLGTH